jgi:RND family efflux transporter MFP subunit
MKTMWSRYIFGTALVALLGTTVAVGCDQQAGEDEKEAEALAIDITTVETGDLTRWLGYVGDIEGASEIRVFSPIPDRIIKLPVKEGDRVRAGQVLATVRSGMLRQGVKQASSGVDAARAQKAALQDQLDRMRRLESSGAVTSSQMLAVESQLAAAAAQEEQLRAMLGQARQRRGDAVIKAPIGGVVGQVFMKVGDMAVPQIPICTVVDMDLVRIKVRVPETDLPLLKPGQPVQLQVAVTDDAPISGQVARVSPVLDRLSRTATMEVDLQNPTHALKPGMLARIQVEVERRENVVAVPKTALTVTAKRKNQQNLYRAMVARGDKAEERFVLLGLEQGDRVEVLEGLAVGDQLIVKGQHMLADGDPIQPGQAQGSTEASAAKTDPTPKPPPATSAKPPTPTEG